MNVDRYQLANLLEAAARQLRAVEPQLPLDVAIVQALAHRPMSGTQLQQWLHRSKAPVLSECRSLQAAGVITRQGGHYGRWALVLTPAEPQPSVIV